MEKYGTLWRTGFSETLKRSENKGNKFMNMDGIGQNYVSWDKWRKQHVSMVQDKSCGCFPEGRWSGLVTKWCPEAICARRANMQ